MKDLPEIAPEIRALLEEIVADPRSSLRLVPRRALRSWFDGGNTLRAREVSETRAERHLIEAHREALAELLCEASRIAYYMAPVHCFRPLDEEGNPYDPLTAERYWRVRVARRLGYQRESTDHVGLLRACLEGVRPSMGQALASASLSLVPRIEARLCMACHLMGSSPRAALRILRRAVSETSFSAARGLAWAGVGSLQVVLNRIDEAKDAYDKSRHDWPAAWFCLFNLACVTDRIEDAVACSKEIGQLAAPESRLATEALELMSQWARTRPKEEMRRARSSVDRTEDRLSATARRVGLAYGC